MTQNLSKRRAKSSQLTRDPPKLVRGGLGRVMVTAVIVTISGVTSYGSMPLAGVSGAAQEGTASTDVTNALHIFEVSGLRYGVARAVHVLTFAGSQYRLEIALAHHAIDGGVQTPSSMCQSTVGCVAAVNGDFFDMTRVGQPDPGDEVGGIIQNCVLLHTPEVAHQQADLLGQSVSEGLNWSSAIDANGVSVPVTSINQELPMSYTKVHLPLAGTLLFTAPYALRTPSAPGWVTDQFSQVTGANRPTTINSTVELALTAQSSMALKVTPGQVDIVSPVGSTLSSLPIGNIVTMSTTSTSGCNNIGGHPILLNHGVSTPIVAADTYMAKPYARTVIGWTASGENVVMTVDGRDASSGATAKQLVSLLKSLNVVTALDLDGGLSTTFYAHGRVLSALSRTRERPVSTALLVVRIK